MFSTLTGAQRLGRTAACRSFVRLLRTFRETFADKMIIKLIKKLTKMIKPIMMTSNIQMSKSVMITWK